YLLPVGVLFMEDNRSDRVLVNRYGAELLGEDAGDVSEPRPRPLTTPLRIFEGERELNASEHPLYRAARAGQSVPSFEGQLQSAKGTLADVIMSAVPLVNEARELRGGIAVIVDISHRKAVEAHQQVLLYELQHRVKN